MATLNELFHNDSAAIINAITEWLESKKPRSNTAPPRAEIPPRSAQQARQVEHDGEDPFSGEYPQQEPPRQRSAAPQRGYSERPPSSRGQRTRSDVPASDKQERTLYALFKQGLLPECPPKGSLTMRQASAIISRAKGQQNGGSGATR